MRAPTVGFRVLAADDRSSLRTTTAASSRESSGSRAKSATSEVIPD